MTQERDRFAKHLKLDRKTVQVWFQNRRAKLKRDQKIGQEGGGHGAASDTGGRVRGERKRAEQEDETDEIYDDGDEVEGHDGFEDGLVTSFR